MNKRTYYRLPLVLESALSIGGAYSFDTDADVIVDSRNMPFIPASSIAGVLRHASAEETARKLFGSLDGDDTVVRVFDACAEEGAAISVRDNVALEEDDKVAKQGAKFDRQVVDKGARFTAYLELVGETEGIDAEAEIESLIAKLNHGQIKLGSKTTRGLGYVALENGTFEKVTFGTNDVDAWLDFDMFEDACWANAKKIPVGKLTYEGARFTLKLAVKGALSIREYTTELPDEPAGEITAPDYKQLSLGATGNPLIPGSSWAGAFRAQYRKLTGKSDREIGDLFGTVDDKAARSKISFTESEVTDGSWKKPWKKITRNSIDRYTGGTIDGALFTELTHYGGETTLTIDIDEPKAEWLTVIIACIADLNNGYMAVGGLTSVGHGLFEVKDASLEVAGRPVNAFGEAFRCDGDAIPDIEAILAEIGPLGEGELR